jgi:hypothetical protein
MSLGRDSPFVYYPSSTYPFSRDDLGPLLQSRFVARSELDDCGQIRQPPKEELVARLVEAPLLRHLVRYDQASTTFDVSPGSGRLLHYAVANGQRSLVQQYIEAGGDLNVRTNPLVAMQDLRARGCEGLHDAAVTPVVVALWSRQHEVLSDLLEGNADFNLGGVVLLEGGDAVRSIVRELCDVDRLDFAPAAAGRRRSTVFYAVRAGDLRGLELLVERSRRTGLRLGVHPTDLEAARARRDPLIAARLQGAIDAGTFTLSEAAEELLAAKQAPAGDLTRSMRQMQTMSLVIISAVVLMVLAYVGLAVLQTKGRVGGRE